MTINLQRNTFVSSNTSACISTPQGIDADTSVLIAGLKEKFDTYSRFVSIPKASPLPISEIDQKSAKELGAIIQSVQQERVNTHAEVCKTMDKLDDLYVRTADKKLSLKMALLAQEHASTTHTIAHQAKHKAFEERLSTLKESLQKLTTNVAQLVATNQADVAQITTLAKTNAQLTALANTCCGGVGNECGLRTRNVADYSTPCRHTTY